MICIEASRFTFSFRATRVWVTKSLMTKNRSMKRTIKSLIIFMSIVFFLSVHWIKEVLNTIQSYQEMTVTTSQRTRSSRLVFWWTQRALLSLEYLAIKLPTQRNSFLKWQCPCLNLPHILHTTILLRRRAWGILQAVLKRNALVRVGYPLYKTQCRFTICKWNSSGGTLRFFWHSFRLVFLRDPSRIPSDFLNGRKENNWNCAMRVYNRHWTGVSRSTCSSADLIFFVESRSCRLIIF